ncbi:MAG: restriction endonuclease [Magnetococcales bacterium]|nr:restriction endonuclease [Magnetococcales bacterium]
MSDAVQYYDYLHERKMGDWEYMFWHLTETCPYCGTPLNCIKSVPYGYDGEYGKELASNEQTLAKLIAEICNTCQWWRVVELISDDFWKSGHSFGHYTHAVLKTTTIDSASIPLDALEDYLKNNPDKVYNIHYKKMEELACSIIREQYMCDVQLCGRSHDGGIDLLMIVGEEITPIQVKRRMSPSRREGVSVVREMMGVMLRDGYRNAKVITTAEKFTYDAINDVSKLLASGRADTFELIDFGMFMGLLKSRYGNQKKSYLDAIPLLLGGFGTI